MTGRSKILSRRKRLAFYFIVFLIPSTTIAAGYIIHTSYRTALLYRYIKNNERGWRGTVHRADSELGFAPVPDSRGAEVFPTGDDIPARYDQDGFRVPVEEET